MSRKKKSALLVALAFSLFVLAVLGSLLYLQARPEGSFAQFLQRRGIQVDAVLDQPPVEVVSRKLGELIPGLQVQARGTGQVATAISPAVFNGITIKGVIGTSADSTVVINAGGQSHWVKVGGQFSVRVPKGSVTIRCEEIRPGFVVLGVANSDLRREYALR